MLIWNLRVIVLCIINIDLIINKFTDFRLDLIKYTQDVSTYFNNMIESFENSKNLGVGGRGDFLYFKVLKVFFF